MFSVSNVKQQKWQLRGQARGQSDELGMQGASGYLNKIVIKDICCSF